MENKFSYSKVTAGKAIQTRFSFQKFGSGSRAQIGKIFVHKEMGAGGKVKTIIDSPQGELSALPTSLFSRDK
ncbi:MAG: hypothetical protein AABY64_09845 [Bdellovibrionota bacterium]